MASYTITNGMASSYPVKHYGGHVKGNVMTFCEDSDLQAPSSNILLLPNAPVARLVEGQIYCSPEMFGLTVQKRANDGFTDIGYDIIRTHDLDGGKGQWKRIETADNVWDFSVLDPWVALQKSLRKKIIFTLFGTPSIHSARSSEQGVYGPTNLGMQAEPLDMTKWTRFCTKIAERYGTDIAYYEVWNEPNIGNNGVGDGIDGTGLTPAGKADKNFFFSGRFGKLAEMTRLAAQAVKAVNPNAKIISAPMTNLHSANRAGDTAYAEGYLTTLLGTSTGDGSTTMKDWVDIIGVHLYLVASEGGNACTGLPGIIDRINAAKLAAGVSSLETWDTESAPIVTGATAMTDAQLAAYLYRFYIICAWKGIKRSIFYSLDHSTMGIVGRTTAYDVFNRVQSLLVNGRINGGLSRMSDGRLAYWTNSGLHFI